MRIDIITIFPGMFEAVLGESIIKRAQEKGKVKIQVHDLRDFTTDKHRKVDDRPFGGGSGMVLAPQPILSAVSSILRKTPFPRKQKKVILLCPQGTQMKQPLAKKLSRERHIVLICGRYEGVDERVKRSVDMVLSIGDYVLTGGELPAMVVVDCLIRLVPGVLGDKNSLNFESFEGNLLEYPQYTRPANFKGMKVPPVLLSGDHKKIEEWRSQQALKRTAYCRPDLLELPKGKSRP